MSSSFKLFNTTLNQQQQVDSILTTSSSSTPALYNVYVHDSGSTLNVYTLPNQTVIYNQNGSEVQFYLDLPGSQSPPIGTEYTVVNDANSLMYFISSDSTVIITLSNNSFNTGNSNVVAMAVLCRCTVIKVSATLWMVSGDGLTYSD